MKTITTPDYPIIVHGVQEIITLIRCNAAVINAYLQEVLHEPRLKATETKGEANIGIIATDLTWKGMHSNELIIGLDVEDPQKEYPSGSYLLHAYNSSKLFAWVERTFYKTPYHHAEFSDFNTKNARVQVNDAHSESMVTFSGAGEFKGNNEEFFLECPVYLPNLNTDSASVPNKYFYVRISGAMKVRNYEKDDIFYLNNKTVPLADLFENAGARQVVKAVRSNAVHCKSRTFTRPF